MNPIFLVGVPRSGSTMLRMILDSHPLIYSGSEMPWIAGNYGDDDMSPDVSFRGLFQILVGADSSFAKNLHIDVEQMRKIFNAFIKEIIELRLAACGKNIWVEKTPDNIIQIPFLKEIFPEAKFIRIIRDGRDVALSTLEVESWNALGYFVDFTEMNMRFHRLRRLLNDRIFYNLPGFMQELFFSTSREPAQATAKMLHFPIANTYYNALFRWKKWNQKYEADVKKYNIDQISFKYEDMLLKPKEVLSKIFDFIGIEWDEKVIAYSSCLHDVGKDDIGSLSALKFSSIESQNMNKWKKCLTSRQKKITVRYFNDYLCEMGYEPTSY